MATPRLLVEKLGGSPAGPLTHVGRADGATRGAAAPARDGGRRPLRNVGRIEVDQVIPDPEQPRTEFSDGALARLAQSILDKGQMSPIRVRWSESAGKWIIISGERRWRATRLAGLPTIDCHFHEGELTQSEILEQQLIENLLREDLQPVEEARSFSILMEMNGWNGKQLARALRIPTSKVSRSLALLRLPAELQAKVDRGEIPARSAYELSKIPNDRARAALAEKAAAGAMTNDALARAARIRKGRPAPKARSTRVDLQAADGWKIVVSAGRKGTYHEVELALLEALEEVRTRIQNNVQLF
jgi:ParB family chromosome partitioning protein